MIIILLNLLAFYAKLMLSNLECQDIIDHSIEILYTRTWEILPEDWYYTLIFLLTYNWKEIKKDLYAVKKSL